MRATLVDGAGRARDRPRRGGGAAARHARGSARAAGDDRRRRRPRLRGAPITADPATSPSRCARGAAGQSRRARGRGGSGPRRLGAPRRRRRCTRRWAATHADSSWSPTSRCRSPTPSGWRRTRAPAPPAPGSPASRSRSAATGAPTRVAARGRRGGAGARFGLDANAGFAAHEALALLDAALADGLDVECFEQPCAATISRAWPRSPPRSPVPVVADESFRGPSTISTGSSRARAAQAVNLKLGKLGGPLAALALGRARARRGPRPDGGRDGRDAGRPARDGARGRRRWAASNGSTSTPPSCSPTIPSTGGWTCDGPRLRLDGRSRAGRQRPPALRAGLYAARGRAERTRDSSSSSRRLWSRPPP